MLSYELRNHLIRDDREKKPPPQIKPNLQSWLTRAARCAWPRGCGIALQKARYVWWVHKPHNFPEQDYTEKLPLPLNFYKYFYTYRKSIYMFKWHFYYSQVQTPWMTKNIRSMKILLNKINVLLLYKGQSHNKSHNHNKATRRLPPRSTTRQAAELLKWLMKTLPCFSMTEQVNYTLYLLPGQAS